MPSNNDWSLEGLLSINGWDGINSNASTVRVSSEDFWQWRDNLEQGAEGVTYWRDSDFTMDSNYTNNSQFIFEEYEECTPITIDCNPTTYGVFTYEEPEDEVGNEFEAGDIKAYLGELVK